MDARARDRLAIAIAVVATLLGIGTIAFGRFDPGIQLAIADDGRVVVEHVNELSLAHQFGLRDGMIVVRLDSATLIDLPHDVGAETEPTPDPLTGEYPPYQPVIEPAAPTVVPMDRAVLERLVAQPALNLEAIQPWDLAQGSYEFGWNLVGLYDDGRSAIRDAAPSVFVGVAVFVLLGWWLASGRGGATLRSLALPLATATTGAFLVRPLLSMWSPVVITIGGVVVVLAMLPLALGLLEKIDDRDDRRVVGAAIAVCVVAGVVLAALFGASDLDRQGLARWVIVGAIPLIPGLAAAGPIQSGASWGTGASSVRLMESTEFAVVGATPLVALATDPSYNLILFPLSAWFVVVLLAGRFTIRPLARLASRAALQRDLVVAATEAERARVAADIHDDALQELTLLVHRLDAAGDTEGADLARTVSDRLRAICGDLRLPILDDLGVGPALDWLVLRIERLAGGEVRLERADGTRPPAEVELAIFRVAQEALSNAVKHGRPPIVVRYSTSREGASLTVDDAGPGIEPDAGETAPGTGHFGLLNMQQRAEAIGAILDVRRWPGGGTHVKLDWRAP